MRGSGKGDYYVELAREDYYLEGGEPPGRWYGEGARLFGLAGRLDKTDFRNLLAGYNLDGSEKLVQNAGEKSRQSGWDLTFSAPKSVSVFWSQADESSRRQIQAAQATALESGLDYLQEVAGLTRRGQGGAALERAPLLFATFEHSTSRAQDPQLHTHAILLNLAPRDDGTSGTVWSKEIFRHKMAAGALYRAELAHELRQRLGVELEPTRNSFEIRGVPRELCEDFSKRRAQIKERLSQWGKESAVAAKAANFETRAKKAEVSRRKLFAAWQEVGRQFGWSTRESRRLLDRQVKVAAHEHDGDIDRLIASLPDKKLARPHRAVRILARAGQGKGVSGRRIVEQLKAKRGPLALHVVHRRLFAEAPWWSPLSKVYAPSLRPARRGPKRRWGRVVATARIPGGTVQLRQRFLFPAAPKWSPARHLALPALRFDKRQGKWQRFMQRLASAPQRAVQASGRRERERREQRQRA